MAKDTVRGMLIKNTLPGLLKWIRNTFWDPFWWVFIMVIVFLVPFLRPWWWLFAPLVLSIELRTLYLWWLDWDFAYAETKWTVLEIIPPKEVLVPLKAMEDVFTSMVGPLIDTANFRELWCSGELDNTPYWMSFEIVSLEGRVHFIARVMDQHRAALESFLYSHYPELEIREVPDYTKNFPQDIPNADWDMYGEDYVLQNSSAYPIRTYEKFFEPQGEKISAEEKRIDPINSLLEMMSLLGPGENFLMQFIFAAASDDDAPEWREEGQAIINKLANRPVKKDTSFFQDLWIVLYNIIVGPQKEGSGEKAEYSWLQAAKSDTGEREMVLTPGERETILEIEKKMKNPAYKTNIRGVYLAKRENFKYSHRLIARAYTGHFNTEAQVLRFGNISRTRVHDIFRKRRVFLRSRKMFRNAVMRFTPLFPDRKSECPILSPEELTTLFHFPVKINALNFPSIERVEHKKGGPPADLPIE